TYLCHPEHKTRDAQMAKLVDALCSGRSAGNGALVRIQFWAPKAKPALRAGFAFLLKRRRPCKTRNTVLPPLHFQYANKVFIAGQPLNQQQWRDLRPFPDIVVRTNTFCPDSEATIAT